MQYRLIFVLKKYLYLIINNSIYSTNIKIQKIIDNKLLKSNNNKIRNEFLNWTHQKTINRKILSVEQAGTSHGGDGAFFVYLRKNKN